MDAPVTVTRDIELDVDVAALWELVSNGDQWASWLVQQAAINVDDGCAGTVVDDDGLARSVRVDRVVDGERVCFTWWPSDSPEQSSAVELGVMPRDGGSTLHVTETFAQASPRESDRAGAAWDLRALALWSCVLAFARA